MLELTDASRQQIHELQELADKVEADPDDRGARKECAPEVIARCSDTARNYRSILTKTVSGGNALVQEAISERASRIAIEVAGEKPTPLEVLGGAYRLPVGGGGAAGGPGRRVVHPEQYEPHEPGVHAPEVQTAGEHQQKIPRRYPRAGPGKEAAEGRGRPVQHADQRPVAKLLRVPFSKAAKTLSRVLWVNRVNRGNAPIAVESGSAVTPRCLALHNSAPHPKFA